MRIIIYISPAHLEYFVEYIDRKDLSLNPPYYRLTPGTGTWINSIITYNDYVWLTDNTKPSDI